MSESKISKRILFVIGAVLCCIFAVILVCNLTIIIKGVANPRIPPSVFGVTPMVVQSGSMSGNAEDHIEVGDLIFTVKPDTDKLKAELERLRAAAREKNPEKEDDGKT